MSSLVSRNESWTRWPIVRLYSASSVSIVFSPFALYTFSTATTHTHARAFNGPLSGTTRDSRYQKGKTNLDFTGARDSEWQWHQLGHANLHLTPDRKPRQHLTTQFLQAGCPSCRPTNSVKALKAHLQHSHHTKYLSSSNLDNVHLSQSTRKLHLKTRASDSSHAL